MKTAFKSLGLAALLSLGTAFGPSAFAAAAGKEQYIPLATYRVGAYASSGIPMWAGVKDYFRYINEA